MVELSKVISTRYYNSSLFLRADFETLMVTNKISSEGGGEACCFCTPNKQKKKKNITGKKKKPEKLQTEADVHLQKGFDK